MDVPHVVSDTPFTSHLYLFIPLVQTFFLFLFSNFEHKFQTCLKWHRVTEVAPQTTQICPKPVRPLPAGGASGIIPDS